MPFWVFPKMSSHILRSLEVAESYTRNAVFTSYSAFAVVGAIKQIAALAKTALNQIRGILPRSLNLPAQEVRQRLLRVHPAHRRRWRLRAWRSGRKLDRKP